MHLLVYELLNKFFGYFYSISATIPWKIYLENMSFKLQYKKMQHRFIWVCFELPNCFSKGMTKLIYNFSNKSVAIARELSKG